MPELQSLIAKGFEHLTKGGDRKVAAKEETAVRAAINTRDAVRLTAKERPALPEVKPMAGLVRQGFAASEASRASSNALMTYQSLQQQWNMAFDDMTKDNIETSMLSTMKGALDQVRARAALERDKAMAEEQLRASNARLEVLLREVNHGVANSLQLVTAMVRLQAKSLGDPAAREALADTERRIDAIAQVHRSLYATDDAEGVDMRDYLQALVDELGGAWASDEPKRALTLDAEPIRLPADRAVSLGVIVNELVSNAFKYAYAPAGPGEVRVSLTRCADDFLLAVEDDGVGLGDAPRAQGSGLGSRLIGAMAKSLKGAIEYESPGRGLRATLRAAIA